jgi:hypothetical protein
LLPPSRRIYHVTPAAAGAAANVTVVTADFVCSGVPLSPTVAVNVNTPLAVGVPEMIPVLATKVSPVGNAPDVIDQA